MNYIRTKDEICTLSEAYWAGIEDEIIAQADTIEELCDEFVLHYREYRQDLIPHATYERNSESWKNNKKEVIRELNNKDRKAEVFGAIWTDKGLIYVAKMNSDGVLELI